MKDDFHGWSVPDAEPSHPWRILVVEDDSTEADYLAEGLEALGCEVPRRVHSGQDALRAVEEVEVDLVLMDIVMPGQVDGIEAADRILSDAGIPVVFVTG